MEFILDKKYSDDILELVYELKHKLENKGESLRITKNNGQKYVYFVAYGVSSFHKSSMVKPFTAFKELDYKLDTAKKIYDFEKNLINQLDIDGKLSDYRLLISSLTLMSEPNHKQIF